MQELRWVSRWLGRGVICLAVGCSSQDASPTQPTEAASASSETKPEANAASTPADRYRQSFAEAVTTDVGEDQQLPPDRTIAGKSTAVFREEIEKLWPTLEIVDAKGQPTSPRILLETEAGPIEIQLNPTVAPNHVRNFLALVQVGYYDGLRFDRIVHQEGVTEAGEKVRLDLIRAGCPAGTGDAGIGHIGYHLKPEFSDIKHDVGTVGMSHDADPTTGGVRFYITLGPAPVLDGNFTVIGQVSQGIETVKKIASAKVLSPEIDPTRELPEKPVTIQRAYRPEKVDGRK